MGQEFNFRPDEMNKAQNKWAELRMAGLEPRITFNYDTNGITVSWSNSGE